MKRNILLAGAAAFALAALAVMAAYFYIPGGVRPVFGEGELHVCLNEDGTIQLDWPQARLDDSTPEAPAEASQEVPAKEADSEPLSEQAAPEDAPAIFYDVDVKSEHDRFHQSQSSPGILLEKFTLPLEIRVRAVTEGRNLLGLPKKLTSQILTAEVEDPALNAPEVVGAPGPGSLSLSWKLAGAAPGFYEVFSLDEDGASSQVAEVSAKNLELKVGRGGDVPLPGYGHPLQVQVRSAVQGKGCVLCGPASNLISVERQDLLGDDLHLTCYEAEPRTATLEWDETRGEYYELQEWGEEGWTLLDTLEPAESFLYELGRLRSGSHHRYQVVARDANGTLRSSEEVEFYATIDPLYATVWPIIDQPYYERPDAGSPSLGKIPGGTALCVLEERGDWFQVRYKDQYGYVDSRFCMINLPEYVGDHCAYDITNSYRSMFKVHENPIALITDQVIAGFEHIQEADGEFLVPYLYPCAQKLLTAALDAEEDGYRLKIYEAFRPNEATRYLYDTTAAQLDWAALVYSYEDADGNPLGDGEEPGILDPVTGWSVDLADGLLLDPESGEKISREDLAQRQAEEQAALEEENGQVPEDGLSPETAPEVLTDPEDPSQPFIILPQEGDETGLQAAEPSSEPEPAAKPETPSETESSSEPEALSEPPAAAPSESQPEQADSQPLEGGGAAEAGGESEGEEEPAPEYDTYFQIMTDNGRFHLGSFLARVTSAHNRGIALDLTLEKIDSGEELEMQSAIHDLSWYSAAYRNNDNAKLLERYMTGVGLRGLTSEWWHFQDDETRESIGLSSYLSRGVDLGGWTRDDRGWRYREEDGTILKGTTVTVDGKRWTLDRDGYAVE